MMPQNMHLRDLARNLGLRKSGDSYHGACPVCGYKSGFQLAQDTHGRLLGYCHAGKCNLTDFFRVLYQKEHVPTRKGPKPFTMQEYDDWDKNLLQERCSDLWLQACPAEGTIVETYLQSRGLSCLIPPSIRLLKAHLHSESQQELPVMLARVDRPGSGKLMGIHRTFLKPDGSGKAAVEPNKKSLGYVKGGAVYLGNPGETVGVSEGIENGLTYQQATGIPTLAALSTGGLEYLVLPPLPLAKQVVVVADHDSPGIRAAHRAAERWAVEGRTVTLVLPPEEGMDLNDLLIDSLKNKGKF